MIMTLVIGLACLALGAVAAAPCFILAIRWGLIGPPPRGDIAQAAAPEFEWAPPTRSPLVDRARPPILP
jgi:hypothetical protein